ncbi:metal ABC transporter substrate-binding protein [Pseudomonas sp. Cab53]|uniref:metal ABC transporter substrate-binding protein n=1 Tax=Pseudomonas TaxID=286 RepID=UPI000A9E13F2|nr:MULTISPECIES: zinc ABC transporter substrate-binding protein [Pseudomonas]BBP64578.1 metal ABC transporter substrate-binding protein [Pseudomonas sp. Cab53]
MKRLGRSSRSWLALLVLLLGTPPAAFAGPRVLVALPALQALTSALSADTGIEVVRLPPDAATPMESQANALARLDASVFQQADAVITLGSLWRADPLFAAARRHNLRTVEIDASRSWDSIRPGVAVARTPANDVPWAGARNGNGGPSPYAWLGPINAMRLSANIAADLIRLAPADAPQIQRNLTTLEGGLRQLKAEYGDRLAQRPDLRVLSLADEFIYLFGEFDIFVDGWFVCQDVDWSDDDRAALSRYLRERDIHVVVHKWAPDARIAKAIEDGGARLLILDAGNPGILAKGTVAYDALVRVNLDALLTAFAATDTHQ